MSDATERTARLVTYVLQAGLAGLLAYAAATGQSRLLTNTAMTLVVAAVPLYVRVRYARPLNPYLALWIVLAAFLHAAGITGPYRTYGWYDQVAHFVSGALIAGVGYAVVTTIEREYDSVAIPDDLRYLFVIVFTLSAGVLWEVGEFALGMVAGGTGDAVLIQYGLDDVVWDLVFDLIGGVVVALWVHDTFGGFRRLLTGHLGGDAEAETEADGAR